MTTVKNTVAGPNGAPISGTTVTINLIAPSGAFVIGTNTEVAGTYTLTTGTDGVWSIDLTPNANITGTSYYTVNEPAISRSTAFLVPTTGGPLWLSDIRIPAPAGDNSATMSNDVDDLSAYYTKAQTDADISSSVSGRAMATHTHVETDVTNLVSDLGNKLASSQLGVANGAASLDSGGRIPVGQVPDLSPTYVTTARIGVASGVAGLDATTKIPAALIPLDVTAADIAATTTGAATAGATGKAADAGHVHPLGAHAGSHGSGGTDAITIAESQVTNLATDLGNRVLTSQIGAASGVAGLDSSGQVPAGQATGVFVPVTSRSHFNGNGGAGAGALPAVWMRYSRTLRRVTRGGASQLKCEWANIFTNNTTGATEVNGPNSCTIRMSVEYPAGQWRQVSGSTAWSSATAYIPRDQVTYGGNAYVALANSTNVTPTVGGNASWAQVQQYVARWDGDDGAGTLTVAPGAIVASRAVTLPASVPAGACVAVNMTVNTGSNTNQFPYGFQASVTAPFIDWSQDWTASPPAPGSGTDPVTNWVTTATNAATSSTYLPAPSVVTGNAPDKRTTLVLGDSIANGTGDTVVDGQQAGWIVRALQGAPYWRCAQGGNQMGTYSTVGATPWQMAAAARCTTAICQLGVNDLQQSQTAATIQSRAQTVWTELAKRGLRVWATQLGPFTNSTDSWATIANQTAWTTGGAGQFGAASQWTTYNAWIADGAPITVEGATVRAGQSLHPLAGVISPARAVIDAGTGWKWVVNGNANGYTIDGAHPSTLGHSTIAGAAQPVMAAITGGGVDRAPTSGLSIPSVAHDWALYGDALSTTERRHVGSSYTNLVGNYVITAGVATRTVTVTQATYGFLNGTAGTATQGMGLYVGGDVSALPQVATMPITQTQLTAVGPYIYTVALSQPVTIQAGSRWVVLLYISGYSPAPGWFSAPGAAGATAVNFYSTLFSPDPGHMFAAAKTGAVLPLPATLNTADGSWSAIAQQPWIALS